MRIAAGAEAVPGVTATDGSMKLMLCGLSDTIYGASGDIPELKRLIGEAYAPSDIALAFHDFTQ